MDDTTPTTSLRARMDAAIARRNLLEHPFYQSWRAGTLPLGDLKAYAADYGTFIARVGEGWATLDQPEHAAEEDEHAELWEKFAETLGTRVPARPTTPEAKDLVETASTLFSERATAIGALYAFETQQPNTSRSKLDGLREHYDLDTDAETYFEVHAGDYHEAEMLADDMAGLDEDEQARAAEACETMCNKLWNALTGVHSAAC